MKDAFGGYSRNVEIKAITIGTCFMRITQDKRHRRANPIFPVAISFYFKGLSNTTLYYPLPFKMTEAEYDAVCRSTGKGRPSSAGQGQYRIKLQIIELFDDVVGRVTVFSQHNMLTPSSIKSLLFNDTSDAYISFLDFWKKYASSKSIGTADSYNTARRSFISIVGDIPGFKISSSEVSLWIKGMSEPPKPLSQTTIGIYLRAFRAVWNAASELGLVSQADYPFGRTATKIKIPQGSNRLKEYLSVEQMTELYNLYLSASMPDSIPEKEREPIRFSLGIFLAQYLCNGCNLADLAELKYDDYFFATQGRALRFVRHKTKDRSAKEVIIPITHHLESVLKQLASPAETGCLVFPEIAKNAVGNDRELQRRVRQENKNVRERMSRLLSCLEWSVSPSGTWARHSFATNLSHAGVPHEYISEAMGHSVAHASVTSRYIDMYPLQMQMDYNSKLIDQPAGSPVLESDGSTVTISRAEYEKLLSLLKSDK